MGEPVPWSLEQPAVDGVEDRVVLPELPGKKAVATDHSPIVLQS